jgi:hypothetical protein
VILAPDNRLLIPARCPRCGRFRIPRRTRRRFAPRWRSSAPLLNSGVQIGDSGLVIGDSGVLITDGTEANADTCCCTGTASPEPCACSNCTNDANLMACCWRLDLAGITTCPGFTHPNGNGSYPLWYTLPSGSCAAHSGAYDMSGAAVPINGAGTNLTATLSRGASNKWGVGASYSPNGMFSNSPGLVTVASCFDAFSTTNTLVCGGIVGGSGGTANLTPIACPWATVCDEVCDTRCTGCSYCLNGTVAKITVAAASMTGCTGGTCAGSSIGGGVFTSARPSLYSAGPPKVVNWAVPGFISGWHYELVRNCVAGTWTLTISGAGGCAFESTSAAQGCLGGSGTLTGRDGSGHTCTVSGGAWSAVIQTNGNC